MPWRSRPRAASAFSLLWAVVLVAAEGMVCAQLVRYGPPPPVSTFSCVRVRSDRWNLLPGIELTGRLKIELAPRHGGAMVFVIGDALPLDLEAHSAGGAPVPLHRETVRATAAPTDFWLEFGSPWSAPETIVHARLDALPERMRVVSLSLGRRAPRVLARLIGYDDDARARVCAAPVAATRAFEHSDEFAITPSLANYFATGWYGQENVARTRGQVRWMRQHGAVLVPSARDGRVRVRLRATPAAAVGDDGPSLTLHVNEVFQSEPRPMRQGPTVYEWLVPATAWVIGTNELLFSVSRTIVPSDRAALGWQPVGLALQRLDLRRE